MQWDDTGILLRKQKFGESQHILVFLTPLFGKRAALYRLKSLKHPEPGECFQLTWKGRLQEHLGHWSFLERLGSPLLMHILGHSGKLYALSSALYLTDKMLADQDPHTVLYEALLSFIETLKHNDPKWILSYLFYEITLLREIGFGLDLSRCAVTGSVHSLAFVSPRTGHAVTALAGKDYLDRLLPLPPFLKEWERDTKKRDRNKRSSRA